MSEVTPIKPRRVPRNPATEEAAEAFSCDLANVRIAIEAARNALLRHTAQEREILAMLKVAILATEHLVGRVPGDEVRT